ncbi:MAG: MotA/TolQ/ExbB proton channel family protein [Phycisphaerales bacterium]|nr:MotA/TolQ/ExbB proton channel family protein [Phycisphaerales bacterium]
MSDSILNDAPRTEPAWNGWAWVGLCAFVGMLAWAITDKGRYSIWQFIDYPSVAIVVGSTLSLLLITFGMRGVAQAVCNLWYLRAAEDERKRASTVFRMAAVFALGSGCLGTLIGAVLMLSNMDDPSKIGQGLAVALLAQLYGVLLALILVAMSVAVYRERPAAQQSIFAWQAVGVFSAAAAVGTLVVCSAIGFVMLSMMGLR